MKTLSAFNQTAIDNPNVSPIRLAKIEFDGLTLFFCDRVFGVAGSEFVFDSQIYEPFVLNWGDINYGSVGQLGGAGTPGETNFTVDNTENIAGFDSFTGIFSTYDPIYSKVTIYEMYEGASSSSDLITKFIGTIEDIDMELEQVTVHITSYEISIANKFTVTICDEDGYPGADPDDWGKMLPIVYGENDRVPFISVDAGAMDVLAEDITAAATEIDGSDLSKFPQGGGTIQIDFETMTYTYIDGNTFKGVTRGVDDTDPPATSAAPHDTGATIAEIQTAYFFIIGHPVKSIDSVYVVNRNNDENVLQSSDIYDTYTGQSGDEHPSYPGKACIVFNTLPTIAPQVNLEVDEDIETQDTIVVNDTIAVVDPLHAHGGNTYGIWHTEFGYIVSGDTYPTQPSAMFDNNMGTYCTFGHGGAQVNGQKLQAEELGALPLFYRVRGLLLFMDSAARGRVTWSGASFTTPTGATRAIYESGWISAPWTNWSQIQAIITEVKNIASVGTPGFISWNDIWVEFQQLEVTPNYSGASKDGGAAKGGEAVKTGTAWLVGNSVADTVIGGQVSADVQGWEADASGDFGTDGDVIERPDYVFKHFLTNYCGLTIADNIDASSYNESGSLYANDNVRLGVVLLDRPDMMSFLAAMGYQAKSYQFWLEGRHYIKRVPTTESTDKVIEGGRIDIDSVKVQYTPRAEVINRYIINFDKQWIGDFESNLESYRSVQTVDNSPSQSVYGILEGDPINLDFVGNSTQALRMGNWALDDTSYTRLIVSFSGGQYLADMEEGDIIEFRFEDGDELDKRLLGLVVSESDQFRIMGMVESESGRIHVTTYFVPSSTSSSGTFYPAQLNDDGYTQGANFYNTTVSNMIGNYTGSVFTSTTTTTTSSTASTTTSSSSTTSTISTTSSSTTTSSTASSTSTISTTSTTRSTSTTSSTASTSSTTNTTASTHTSFSTTTTSSSTTTTTTV